MIDFPFQDHALLPPRPANSEEELAAARATLRKPQAAEIRQWINWRIDPSNYDRPGSWSGNVSVTSDRSFTDTATPKATLTIRLGEPLVAPYELIVYGPGRRALGRFRNSPNQPGNIGNATSVNLVVTPGSPLRRYTAEVSYETPTVGPPVRILASAGRSSHDSIDINANREALYVALGDSFSAGVGIGQPFDSSTQYGERPAFYKVPGIGVMNPFLQWQDPGPWTDCWRHEDAYPHLITRAAFAAANGYTAQPYKVRHVACKGWRADQMLANTDYIDDRSLYGDADQLSYVTPNTRLVTIGIGGNDADFARTLERCEDYRGGGSGDGPCTRFDASTRDGIKNLTASRSNTLAKLYTRIQRKAPKARVLVGDYSRFWPTRVNVPPFGWFTPGGRCGGIRSSDKPWMNTMIRLLDKAIGDAAKASHVERVSLLGAFNGHEICGGDGQNWQHAGQGDGYLDGEHDNSYHPTREGYQQIAREYLKQLALPRPPATGTTRPGQRTFKSMSVPVGSEIMGVNTSWPGSDVVTTLTSPSGRVIDRSTVAEDVIHDVTDTWENYVVAHPEAGEWQIEIYGADVAPDGEPFTLEVFAADPPLRLPVPAVTITQNGSTVSYDATASSDAGGGPLTYVWDFDDGTESNAPSGTHTYTGAGHYQISLSVVNADELAAGYAHPPITIERDSVPPTIEIASPADRAQVLKGQSVIASYTCADLGGSVLTTCVGVVPGGSPVDTVTTGTKTFSVTATDGAGNTASQTRSYTVVYAFTGFQAPVNNMPTLNTVNAGRSIPVKFRLGGNQGLDVFALGYPRVQTISCATGALTDEIETTVTAGQSGLSYDQASGTYNYTWKTNTAWAGTCRRLILRLNDNTIHEADFKFR